SSGMILPDGSLFEMDSKWQTINDMDLTKGNFDRLGKEKQDERPPGAISLKEKDALLKKKPFWTWKKAAAGAGVVALIGAGTIFMLGQDDGPGSIKPPGTTDPDPDKEKIDMTEKPPDKP